MAENNNLLRDLNSLSQFDGQEALRDAHDLPGHRFRVVDTVSAVQHYYTHFETTYDVNNNPIKVDYLMGLTSHSTTINVLADVAGSLNNKYFLIYEARSNKLFHIWYNVNNLGTDPDPSPGISTPIEISINSNDPAAVVSGATAIVINNIFSDFFTATNKGSILKITNVDLGVANNSIDGNTLFSIANEVGSETVVQTVYIDYTVDGNPIYEGQELKGYQYNIYTGKFEKNPEVSVSTDVNVEIDAKDGDNVAVSRHKNYRNITVENNLAVGSLSTVIYTEVLSYTATEELVIRSIKLKADTFGAFKVKINGIVKDYYQTSPVDRNAHFIFLEEEDLPNTQDITIEFLPDRLRNLASYNFFMRIESYVEE